MNVCKLAQKATCYALALLLATGLAVGCSTYKGGNFLDGMSLQVGAKIPVSDQIQITALSLVSGTMYQYDSGAKVKIHTTQTNHINIAYIYQSDSVKATDAEMEPVYEPSTNVVEETATENK